MSEKFQFTAIVSEEYAALDAVARKTSRSAHAVKWYIEGPEDSKVKSTLADDMTYDDASSVRWAWRCSCGLETELDSKVASRKALQVHRATKVAEAAAVIPADFLKLVADEPVAEVVVEPEAAKLTRKQRRELAKVQ